MKKRYSALALIFVLLLTLLCACGSADYSAAIDNGAMQDAESWADAPAMMESETAPDEADSAGFSDAVSEKSTDFAEKIIYSASADIETLDFDGTIGKIDGMLSKYGAFLESSYVSGIDYSSRYYGYDVYRTASYTVRVPVDSFEDMKSGLSELGNVIACNTYTENITSQFVDTQSRLETYEIEEERLLSMLEKCETVEDMIAIEERLSNVRYEIESLTSMLKNWQNQVDYSTITLNIQEVRELTEEPDIQRTYWQEVGDSLKGTLKAMGSFFKWLLKAIIAALPVIVLLGVIAAVIIIVIRISVKKKKKGGNGGE